MTSEQKREYDRSWRAKNPEKSKEYRERYYRKNPGKWKEYARASRRRHPEAWKSYHFKSKYGLTLEERDAMFKAQDGKCSICQEHMDDPHIDHVETPFRVRALLCHNCNVSLGLMKENPERLRAAAAYLEKFSA